MGSTKPTACICHPAPGAAPPPAQQPADGPALRSFLLKVSDKKCDAPTGGRQDLKRIRSQR